MFTSIICLTRWVLLVGILICGGYPGFAQEGAARKSIPELLARFPAVDAAERDLASRELLELGESGILSVCRLLSPPGERDDSAARFALHGTAVYVSQANKHKERTLLSRSLLQALKQREEPEVQAFLIRQLQMIAGDKELGSLARYLKHERLCEPATQALLAVGTPKAEKALFKALKSASGQRRVTLIRALGELQSERAVPWILAFAASPQRELRQVSRFALANIGDPKAEGVLTRFSLLSSAYERRSAPALLLLFTRRLGETGHKEAAVRICHRLMEYYTAPGESQIPCTALTILNETLGEAALTDLLGALEHPLKQVRARALELGADMPGQALTSLWIKELEGKQPQVQAEIIGMLGKRGDGSALPVVLKRLHSPNREIRMAAIEAGAVLGGEQVLPRIWPLLDQADPREMRVIQQVLMRFPAAEVVPQSALRLPGASPHVQRALIEVLAARRSRPNALLVMALTGSEHREVRRAALEGLEHMVDDRHLERLLDLLLATERRSEVPMVQKALVAAALQIEDPEMRAVSLLNRYAECSEECKPDLLRPLSGIGGRQALKLVIREIKNPEPRIRSAAVYALSQWPALEAADPLLELCRSTSDGKILYPALQGYLRLIRTSDLPAEVKAARVGEIHGLSLGKQEIELVIDALARIKSPASMELVENYLAEPELAARAARAMQRIALPEAGAEGLWGGEVFALLRKAQPLIEDEHERNRIESYIAACMQGDGFISLFNGQDLSGWMGDTLGYTVRDGRIAVEPSQGSGNLYSEREYADFILRFEFRLTPGANNGLGIRTPTQGDAAYVGLELQILDNSADKYQNLKPYQYHGSVYGVVPARRGFLRPVGDWNYQEVKVQGRRVTVSLNGTVILDADLDEASLSGTLDGREHPGLARQEGHLAFLGHGSQVEFRSLWIKELR